MPSAWIASRAPPARQPLRHEAALGADRHDDGVLDVLRLDEAKDFRAEILRPVGPADAAARHLAEAQMHALDPGRVDKNLIKRPRQRQAVELAACELHRNQLLRRARIVVLIEIRADRSRHRVDEAAEDAVLVEALDGRKRGFDRGGDLGFARRMLRGRSAELRIETGVEQAHDLRRDGRMLAQCRPHVILREGNAHLAQETRQRANERDIAPDEARRQDQRVIAVILGLPAHHGEEAILQAVFERIEVHRPASGRFRASCRGTTHHRTRAA